MSKREPRSIIVHIALGLDADGVSDETVTVERASTRNYPSRRAAKVYEELETFARRVADRIVYEAKLYEAKLSLPARRRALDGERRRLTPSTSRKRVRR